MVKVHVRRINRLGIEVRRKGTTATVSPLASREVGPMPDEMVAEALRLLEGATGPAERADAMSKALGVLAKHWDWPGFADHKRKDFDARIGAAAQELLRQHGRENEHESRRADRLERLIRAWGEQLREQGRTPNSLQLAAVLHDFGRPGDSRAAELVLEAVTAASTTKRGRPPSGNQRGRALADVMHELLKRLAITSRSIETLRKRKARTR